VAQSLIPVVMSGIIAVYALVVAVLIAGNMKPPPQQTYSLYNGFMHLACGLSVGLTGLAAGYAIGIVGDTVRFDHGLGDSRAGNNVKRHGVVGSGERARTSSTSADGFHRACAHTCNSQGSSLVWC